MQLTFLLFTLSAFTILHAQGKKPTDQHFWHSMETSASSNAVWSIWTDVSKWKNWDKGLKDASLEGKFTLDAKGTIISLENRKSKFKVVEYTEGRSYTYKTRLPLGSLYVKRYLEVRNGRVAFTHEVWFKGLTGGIFAKAFGGKFREMLPEVLTNIKNIAEGNDRN